jgi:hypothetical protein
MLSRTGDHEVSKSTCRDTRHVPSKLVQEIANNRNIEVHGRWLNASVFSHPFSELDHHRGVWRGQHLGTGRDDALAAEVSA